MGKTTTAGEFSWGTPRGKMAGARV